MHREGVFRSDSLFQFLLLFLSFFFNVIRLTLILHTRFHRFTVVYDIAALQLFTLFNLTRETL